MISISEADSFSLVFPNFIVQPWRLLCFVSTPLNLSKPTKLSPSEKKMKRKYCFLTSGFIHTKQFSTCAPHCPSLIWLCNQSMGERCSASLTQLYCRSLGFSQACGQKALDGTVDMILCSEPFFIYLLSTNIHLIIAIPLLAAYQNAAARVLTRTNRFEHITPILTYLHWLSVEQRIDFKMLLLVFKSEWFSSVLCH